MGCSEKQGSFTLGRSGPSVSFAREPEGNMVLCTQPKAMLHAQGYIFQDSIQAIIHHPSSNPDKQPDRQAQGRPPMER